MPDTPIERAAEAIGAHMRPVLELDLDVARAVFASIDTDELARTLHAHRFRNMPIPWDALPKSHRVAFRAQAEAVKAHLLGSS
ncbi:hypothetical protein [Oerskovia enterophila]|uniref:hypothetical protein n=1 Tax=Oerskovia enterophila TaxID=43678 RepID=UPI00382302B2